MIEFQSKASVAKSPNEQCAVESTSLSVSQQLADQYQLYQQLPDGHVQVYKLPAGIVPVLVPTNADHLKHDKGNSHQMQFQGTSQNNTSIANNASCIQARNCALVNKLSTGNAGKNEYGDSITSTNAPMVPNFNENIHSSIYDNKLAGDQKGLFVNNSIQPSHKAEDNIHTNLSDALQPSDQGLNIENMQQLPMGDTSGSLIQQSYNVSQSHLQYMSYIPENTQQTVTTLSQQITKNITTSNTSFPLLTDKKVTNYERNNETQVLPSIGTANQSVENMPSDQQNFLAPCIESQNQLQKHDALYNSNNQGYNAIGASQFIPNKIAGPVNTLQPIIDESDSQLSHTVLHNDSNLPTQKALTNLDINASQTSVVSEKQSTDPNMLRNCAISSETVQKLASKSENSSHQQLCEACGSISVVSENAAHKSSTDLHDINAKVDQMVCGGTSTFKCNSPNLSREISQPTLIAPQNTPVHPMKSYTTQTKVIEVDSIISGTIDSTLNRSCSGVGDQNEVKADEISETNIHGLSSLSVSYDKIDVLTGTSYLASKQNKDASHFLF